MFIVRFLQEYKHTESRTWQPGDTPTLTRELAKKLVNELGVAEWVGEGCGCPGIDANVIANANALANRGITQEEVDMAAEAAKEEAATETLAETIASQMSRKKRVLKRKKAKN